MGGKIVMSDLIIEAGEFYKTRGGLKAKALEQVGERIVGYFISGVDDICPRTWYLNGVFCCGVPCDHLDIVAPWTDPPVVDWSKFPTHVVAVAMDKDGLWQGYPYIPIPYDNWWSYKNGDDSFSMCSILIRDIPKFSGDWRDSLAVRPGWEGKE